MTKPEIARLLAMIAHEDGDQDTFNFVLDRIFGAIQGKGVNKWYKSSRYTGYTEQEWTIISIAQNVILKPTIAM